MRGKILGFLQGVAARDYESAAEKLLPPEIAGTPEEEAEVRRESRRIETAFTPYFDDYGRFRLDPEGRSAKHTHFAEVEHFNAETSWEVVQVLVDDEEENSTEVLFTVDLAACRKTGDIRLSFGELRKIG